jgi:prepilin-type processing-associated H-X9-DG protein
MSGRVKGAVVVLVLVFCAAVVAGMFLPAMGRARTTTRKGLCAGNLAQIGKATAMWLVTKGENKFYPPSLKTLVDDKIFNDNRVFLCPSGDTEFQPDKFVSDYASVLDMIGRKTTEDEIPSSLPLAWDKTNIHGDGRNMVFFDANVEFIDEERFQAMMKRLEMFVQDLKAGQKPQWEDTMWKTIKKSLGDF